MCDSAELGPSSLQWQNANSGVCQAGNPAQTLMHETNMIETFHKSWSEKMLPALLESLQLSTKDGKAKLELQFGRPDDFQPGFAAAGHPAGAPNRCQPRSPQGPASKEWSRRRRAALFQASRAAATHGAAPASINSGSGSKPGSFQSPWKSQ